MISLDDYFGKKRQHADATPERVANAEVLLERVNRLLDRAREEGAYEDWIDEDTNSQISGSKGGYGDGGFRLQSSATGRPKSTHKQGQAVDVFDPYQKLDRWLTNELLEEFDLYREAPAFTVGWCHLQSRAPGSGRRTFNP